MATINTLYQNTLYFCQPLTLHSSDSTLSNWLQRVLWFYFLVCCKNNLWMNVVVFSIWLSFCNPRTLDCVKWICSLSSPFNKMMDLQRGGQKSSFFAFRWKGHTGLLGEQWDYTTVSCWTLSWAGRLMWAKTSNASQLLSKVKHFPCVCAAAPSVCLPQT